MRFIIFFAGLFIAAFGHTLELEISPLESLLDQPVCIEIKDAPPFGIVSLTASVMDRNGLTWISSAEYRANSEGTVRLDTDSPLGGSYQGIDPMGLFTTLQCDAISRFEPSPFYTMTFEAKAEGFVKTKSIVRNAICPSVQKVPLRSDGIVGTLFIPKCITPFTAIIALGDADGEIGEEQARMLATRGFTVLKLGYFKTSGPPEKLENIPLAYFENAIDWLGGQGYKVGLYGVSKGARLSLILAATFPDKISSVIAAFPDSLPETTWSSFAVIKSLQEVDYSHISAPVLLISGKEDHEPSLSFTDQITKERPDFTHLYCPKGEPQMHIPFVPLSETCSLDQDSWEKLIEFFSEHMK